MSRIGVLTVLLLSLATGCGAILSGTTQRVALQVSPAGSQVTVYRWTGEVVAGPGISPGALTVHRPARGQPYLVKVSKAGSCPQYIVTSNHISPGGWGTVLVFNGIVPLWIDTATGGLYSIDPDPVVGSLAEDSSCPE